MKYLSIFFTVLLIWVASLLVVAFRPEERSFELFAITLGCTVILFLIGFARR